jgi:acyl carrier protein
VGRDNLVLEINETLSEEFEIDSSKLVPSALLFDDLGLDSLDAVDMLVHLEDKMGVKLNIEKMQNVRTLGDIHTLVESLKLSK